MKRKTLFLLPLLGVAALVFLLLSQRSLEAKKDFAKRLQLIAIAMLLEPHNRPFKARELATLRAALPSVKADNPKLYKDPSRTEKILLLYMILEEIELAAKSEQGVAALVGKTRGQVARDYVERVFLSR